jgi:SAM-dependent methyltransferase
MIELSRQIGDKICELGGGANPVVRPHCMFPESNDINVDVRACYTQDGRQTNDFQANFEEPLPIQSDEWDGVICQYALEHISFPKIRQFLSECLRILKPKGKLVIVTANTEAQCEWIKKHQGGWDGKGLFESASNVLFGSQDYSENSHRSYFSPAILSQLLSEAGFTDALVSPYGERGTDLSAVCVKPDRQSDIKVSTTANGYPQEHQEVIEAGVCGNLGPHGVKCSLAKGHTGNHAGHS